MQKAVEDLVALCRYAAQHPRFVQGGGGNCSVRFGGERVVKASGYFLEDVTAAEGFSVIDNQTGKIKGGGYPKPSLEANLHLLLGSYVIHTHPVAVGVYVCSRQGRELFAGDFPEPGHHWIPYATPGARLAEKVRGSLPADPDWKRQSHVLFLENHGLFVSAPERDECMERHEQVVKRLEPFLEKAAPAVALPAGRYLSPDHAVYGAVQPEAPSKRQRQSMSEINDWARQVFAAMSAQGWQPVWLSEEETRNLLNMKEEKYRQKLWKDKP